MSAYKEITDWYIGLQRRILSEPDLAPLRRLFAEPAAAFADLDTSRQMHRKVMSAMFRQLADPVLAMMVGGIDGFVRDGLGVSDSRLGDGPAGGAAADKLAAAGYAPAASVPALTTAEMRAYFADQPCYAWGQADESELQGLAELRAGGARFARYPTATVLGCPHLVDIVTHADVISAVARHLGAVPTILEYAAWWSFAGQDAAKESQLFHFDFPDHRFCLLFLYLTDVDADGGPHTIVEATHEFRHIAEARSRWPGGETEFDAWYFMKLRKSDAEVARYVGGEAATLTGPAGSCFLVNTRGLHKGMRPRRSDRLVCEVIFGVTPHLDQPFEPLPLGAAETAHIPDRLTSPPFDYVNRLFLTR